MPVGDEPVCCVPSLQHPFLEVLPCLGGQCPDVELLCSLYISSLPLSPLFQSDMYSLGVILLELFQPFGTEMERARVLTGLRTGQLPESLSKRCPLQAKCIQQLTRKNASQRPSALQLLQSELFQSSGSVCIVFFFTMRSLEFV